MELVQSSSCQSMILRDANRVQKIPRLSKRLFMHDIITKPGMAIATFRLIQLRGQCTILLFLRASNSSEGK